MQFSNKPSETMETQTMLLYTHETYKNIVQQPKQSYTTSAIENH